MPADFPDPSTVLRVVLRNSKDDAYLDSVEAFLAEWEAQ